MKPLAFLFGFLLVFSVSVSAVETNTTDSVNSTNTTNVTVSEPSLPCGIKGCIILYGFIADFQPEGGVRLLNLNGVIIRIEPYAASTLNESGFNVQYRLPYTYANNDTFIALPIGIAKGLDQTYINDLKSENGRLKSDLFYWQIAGILMSVFIVGSFAYNYYTEHSEEG